MNGETIDDLEIVQRTDGKWMVEDFAYRFAFGPYVTREGAKAAKQREIDQRLEAIRRERSA